MLVAALTTNLATRAIWVPFMHVIYCLTQESSKCVSLHCNNNNNCRFLANNPKLIDSFKNSKPL